MINTLLYRTQRNSFPPLQKLQISRELGSIRESILLIRLQYFQPLFLQFNVVCQQQGPHTCLVLGPQRILLCLGELGLDQVPQVKLVYFRL
jgi:hypothetical protein